MYLGIQYVRERDRIYPQYMYTRYTSFACTYRKDRISDVRRDDLCTDFMRHVNDVFAGSIKVKCGQTGKVFVTKIHNLSKEYHASRVFNDRGPKGWSRATMRCQRENVPC